MLFLSRECRWGVSEVQQLVIVELSVVMLPTYPGSFRTETSLHGTGIGWVEQGKHARAPFPKSISIIDVAAVCRCPSSWIDHAL